jgi:hypothetical protein
MPSASGFDVFRAVAGSEGLARTAVTARLRLQALEYAQAENLVQCAWSYRVVPLEGPAGDILCLDGEHLPAPWLIPESGELTAVACCVCTIGPLLEERVTALFGERRASLAVALDSIGNELLFAVSRRAQDKIQAEVTKQGLCMAGELRSGDPGLALDTQATVLRLAQAHTIGVRASASGMMSPLKSSSMVLGVGVELPPAQWSRCDNCPSRERCAIAGKRAEVASKTRGTT